MSEPAGGVSEALSRRAFLRGLTLTSAGLLVPKAAYFDQGRRVVRPEGPYGTYVEAFARPMRNMMAGHAYIDFMDGDVFLHLIGYGSVVAMPDGG